MTHDLGDERLAAELLRARDEAKVVPNPSRHEPTFDLARGYQVGHALHQQLAGRGYRPVGRKIGFTNPSTWQEFGVDTPVWAHVYDRSLFFAVNGRYTLSLQATVDPRIEPEIVLKLSAPLPRDKLTPEVVLCCIEWAALGFEVVDSHYSGWKFTGPDAVADFGVHSALVVGTPWAVGEEDSVRVMTELEAVRVTLRGGRDFVATGEGRNALGSPLLAICYLARVLAAQPWAPPLAAGEVIATGTLTALPYVRRGESYHVEVEGAPLGSLELELGS
jgi:2-oxo-3-hexenedioate decarboxylase